MPAAEEILLVKDRGCPACELYSTRGLMSSRSGLFNRLSYRVFRSRSVSRLLYPVLRSMRNLLLKILRKEKVNNPGLAGSTRF